MELSLEKEKIESCISKEIDAIDLNDKISENILLSIDSLRKNKQRPDINSILQEMEKYVTPDIQIELIEDRINDLLTKKLIFNKKYLGNDSFYRVKEHQEKEVATQNQQFHQNSLSKHQNHENETESTSCQDKTKNLATIDHEILNMTSNNDYIFTNEKIHQDYIDLLKEFEENK